jgi:hypothetical protein
MEISAPVTPGTPVPSAKRPKGRKAEVAPEFYSLAHVAFFALPPADRAKFGATTKARIAKGFLPDAKGCINLTFLGIDIRNFLAASDRPVSAGTPYGHAAGDWDRAATLDSTEVGKAIRAAGCTLNQGELGSAMGTSPDKLRRYLRGLDAPTVLEANAAVAVGVPMNVWRIDAAAVAAAKAERKAKREADASATK